jgi:nicotinamide-nucleotide amidase
VSPDREGTPRAVLVTVGDELLLGRTVDGNAAWLGRELSALGVPVASRSTVGDDDLERPA